MVPSTASTQDKHSSSVQPIVGFDAATRLWATRPGGNVVPLPKLDGYILTDPVSLQAVSDDFGHIVQRTPVAVLRPGSVKDICEVVRFARAHTLRIASRGNGHTTFGQSQADGGIVIDMRTLNKIHHIGADTAVVDAGVNWRDLLQATVAKGLTPPILTDYIALTVGGTLSVAGVSGRSFQYGMQVDNVVELEVVTGKGKRLTCSATENNALFEAVLGGMGLCAIIVRATLKLIPAKAMARTTRLFYADVPTMLADLRVLMGRTTFDYLRGNVAPPPMPEGQPATTFAYFIEAANFYDTPDQLPPSLPTDLHFAPDGVQTEDRTYLAFNDQVVELIAALDAAGLGSFPHPWLDLFVPDSDISAFTSQIVASLQPADFLPGSLMLYYPFIRSKLTRPLVSVPNDAQFFLFDILQTVPPVPDVVAAAVARNRQLYEQNRALGGFAYTISAVEMSPADWVAHFGAAYPPLLATYQRHNPDHVLGAGIAF